MLAPTGDAAVATSSRTSISIRPISRISRRLGTLAGFHQYDAQLERYDRASIAKQTATLHDFERRVSGFPKNGLDEWTADDRQLVLNNIHSTLLTLETIKPWEKNPDYYSTGITGQRLFADGAQIRAAGRPASLAHRARAADAGRTHSGAAESAQLPEDLHRNRT